MICEQEAESPTDGELLTAALGGDKQAYGDLLSRHRPRCVELARRITGSREDAEEIVQDVSLFIYRRLHEYRSEWPFAAWLCGTVKRRAIWRTQRQRLPTSAITEAWQEPGDGRLSPPDIAARNERVELVRSAVTRVAEPYRTTIAMRVLRGWKLETIARELGQSVSCVTKDVYRGQSLLRQELESLPAGVRS